MPPRKRSTKESTGAEPASKARRQDNGEGPSTRSEPEDATEGASEGQNEASAPEGDVDPFSYQCIAKPWWGDGVVPDDDEDHEIEGLEFHGKPAAEHPEWKWTIMDQAWSIVVEWQRRTDYCQPDNFDMYIYNDWYGYGLNELQENLLLKFNEEFSKKQKSLEAMWTVIAGMMHWQLNKEMEWVSNDDGEKVIEIFGVIGCALLTMLNEIDRAGFLKPDSQFQDLGLVMLMALKWTFGQENYGIDKEELDWRTTVVAYAKKGGIDLKSTPLGGAQKLLDSIDEDQANEDLGPAEADRWGWKAKLKEFEAKHGTQQRAGAKPKIGGLKYDITKMPSKERASYNFEKVDPVPKIPKGAVLELRSG